MSEKEINSQEGGLNLANLARRAVETFVTQNRVLDAKEWAGASEISFRPSGVFVTLRTGDGNLRGCIGTLRPRHRSVEEEVIDRAIASAVRDSRFDPVSPEELADLSYEVSLLHPPEDVASEKDLDPEVWGVIITGPDGRSGVMLPQVPTLDTVEKQIKATRLKVGIPLTAPITIQRFKVDKIEEE